MSETPTDLRVLAIDDELFQLNGATWQVTVPATLKSPWFTNSTFADFS